MSRSLALLCVALSACTPVMRMPGPPGVVGRAPKHAYGVAGLDDATPRSRPPGEDAAPEEAVAISRSRPSGVGEEAADSARFYLDHRPRGFRDDCSGFVCAVYARAGVPLEGNTASLWELAKARGATHQRAPQVGDIVFFDQTYDRNRNGRLDDELTHVAVVIEIDLDGTLLLAHGGTSTGRATLRMNLDHPEVHVDETGRELNGYLRPPRKDDPKRTKYLAGELWRGFATVDDAWLDDAVAAWNE